MAKPIPVLAFALAAYDAIVRDSSLKQPLDVYLQTQAKDPAGPYKLSELQLLRIENSAQTSG